MKGTTFLHGLATQCRIGCGDTERAAWQPIIIDIVCTTDMRAAIATDERRDCVDYSRLHAIAVVQAQTTTYHLLETLAHDIATRSLALDHVEEITVTIRKPHKLPCSEAVGISLTMTKKELSNA